MISTPKRIELMKARQELLDIAQSYLDIATDLPDEERKLMYVSAIIDLHRLVREYDQYLRSESRMTPKEERFYHIREFLDKI